MVAEEGGQALEQSDEMKAQAVVARNGGYRGWRHEGAVAMPTKEKDRRARRWWQAAAATAGGWLQEADRHP